MTKEVHIIEVFNTTIGHMITVKTDRSFRVGQVIEADGKRYRILGINPHRDPSVDIVALRVDAIN